MFSAAVRVGSRLNDWKMNPTRSRRSRVSRRSSSLVRSTSPRWTRPWSTDSRPARQWSRVDLPDPEGPITALNRPRPKPTVTPSSAVTAAGPVP